MYTKDKRLRPSEATVQLREKSNPDIGWEQRVKTLNINKVKNKS